MICAYCDAAGVDWTDALERDLTGARLMARFGYWREHPPQSVMLRALAAWTGVYKPPAARAAQGQADTMAALRAMFPSGRIGG